MKKLLKVLLVIILASVLLWGLADIWSRHQLKKACEDWPLIDRNLADFSEVFPWRPTNQAAQELEDLYFQFRHKVGIDSHLPDDLSAIQRFEKIIGDYLDRELVTPTGFASPPPEEITSVLSQYEELLDEIAYLLLGDEEPEWLLNVEATAVSTLIWPIKLNRVLVVQALNLSLQGNLARAWLYLHAATRLADVSFLRPERVPQIMAFAQAERILMAMRKMSAPVPSWAVTWPAEHFEYGMLMAFSKDASLNLWAAENGLVTIMQAERDADLNAGNEPKKLGIGIRLYSRFTQPYLRFWETQMIAASKGQIEKRLEEGLCVNVPARFGQFKEQLPQWVSKWGGVGRLLAGYDFIGVGLESSWDSSWFLPHKLMITLTGTRSILAAKAAKAESPDGRWPETLPDVALPCENLAWSYTLAPDGTAAFEYLKPSPMQGSDSATGVLKYIGDATE